MYPCPHPGCGRVLRNKSGLTQHCHSKHGYSHHPQRQRSPSTPRSPSFALPAPSPPPDQPPSRHRTVTPVVDEDELGGGSIVDYHLELDGQPCSLFLFASLITSLIIFFKCQGQLFDEEGLHLHGEPNQPDDWYPYTDHVQFETADLFFRQIQLSASQIDTILRLWSATLVGSVSSPPFQNHRDMYKTIDQTLHGDIAWSSFTLKYNGEMPTDDIPTWMTATYQICYRDPRVVIHGMLAHPGFKDHMDYVPYREYDPKTQTRRWRDFMSGDWAWMQADEIARDPSTHGSTFVPVILGSDKTVVSVATGHTEYWPLYLSIGNVRNNLHRAHKGGVAVIGFLSIPTAKKKHAPSLEFRQFKRKLFHGSIAKILQPLHTAMTIPELVRFGDGHYRRVVYGLGPYIADYEEQVLLACIVRGWCAKCMAFPDNLDAGGSLRTREHLDTLFEETTPGIMWDQYGVAGDTMPFTSHFPRADMYELLAPDILHQLIKGAFKDHLVAWVEQYLVTEHGPTRAQEIMDDIDKRISVVPPFSRLRRFPQGRGFEQWTGDDSKALMKVYLPAIEGHVPSDAVRCFRAFLEFCYIARSDTITEQTILRLEDALKRFHDYRSIFQATGVRVDISLPRQHSMIHYPMLIRLFGAPNGLCSSITESKHIKAVKEPWRRSNRYHALLQMLVTNQRLDKLAAARANFEAKGLLDEDAQGGERGISNHPNGVDDETQPQPQPIINRLRAEESDVKLGSAPRGRHASDVASLTDELKVPHLPRLINRFLCGQLDGNGDHEDPNHTCPRYMGRIRVFNRATAMFHTPSDPSNDQGMRHEVIRATPSWLKGKPRYDCIFVNSNNELHGMRGMEIARAIRFFSFVYLGVTYPCVLVHWFSRISEEPDEDTGMWMVTPDFVRGDPILAVIHVDCIFRAAHLVPIFGNSYIPDHITHDNSLDNFKGFYVNRFVDHHAFDFAS
ncbi:hypothetical protein EDB83DRAFT_2221410 [Lactarius deliciosus]|nr:hypothetical protein EDB83DRAFT_2221410 [Lactarius deliciosus]